MRDALAELHDSAAVHALLRRVDTARLADELGAREYVTPDPDATSRLRVVASLAFAELLGEASVDQLLRTFAAEANGPAASKAQIASFRKWTGYINALLDAKIPPSLDDLFMFAASGLLARQPTEVRSILRQPLVRSSIRNQRDRASELPWSERVRFNVSYSLLLLVRQEGRSDLIASGDGIRRVAEDQRAFESSWLRTQTNARRDATTLLGYYHLAQALERLSEFLLVGTLRSGNQVITDFEPELRRLLVRAEEFIGFGGDSETQMWLSCVSIILWRLRADSLWVTARGISERLDQLLDALTSSERERQVFSLLPSQQEALRQSLLDPNRIAVVLQMPTSAGKTLLAEFSIIQTIENYKGETRIVYVVPTRALATQTYRTLIQDLRPLGIDVVAASSAFEEDPYELNLLVESKGVVVATPEKLDLMLRSHPEWFETLRMVVVDEAHLLQDKERGVRLELLLANIRRERPQAKLLLLTPFLENAQQVATWLGGARGLPITVHWRPSRLLLGLSSIAGAGRNRALTIEWSDPYSRDQSPTPIRIPVSIPSRDVQTTRSRLVYLAHKFQDLGTILGLCTGSRIEAETAALALARTRAVIPETSRTSGLRVAIALAESEYGSDSSLSFCLQRGVAFHHSALSPMLRYLVEEEVRAGVVKIIIATTTLAQGMNFPVAVVLVHSVHKPYGGGNLTPAEFWNIAGRAGRVGLVDRGLVIFTGKDHREHFDRYSSLLTDSVRSALLAVLGSLSPTVELKQLYRQHEELRPFLQYLAHAAASRSPTEALANLEELLQASLANAQVTTEAQSRAMRSVARRYLESIRAQKSGYLRTSDATGLGSFSFDELFAKIGNDAILRAGPGEVLSRRAEGLSHLVDALKWLPELDLAIGLGEGPMNSDAVARVIQGWIDGKTAQDLSTEFPGHEREDRVRKAAAYLFGKVSQTISWGAHAYVRGWFLRQPQNTPDAHRSNEMLPAYIQFGVRTPEAAVASLLGVPRQFAESFGGVFREKHGLLAPESAKMFQGFVETADSGVWRDVVSRSTLKDAVSADDVRGVWRRMQGLDPG